VKGGPVQEKDSTKNKIEAFSYTNLSHGKEKLLNELYDVGLRSEHVKEVSSKVSRINKITSLITNMSIFSLVGYYEWEISSHLPFPSTSDPMYQSFITLVISTSSLLGTKLIHYVGNKIAKAYSKPSSVDHAFNAMGSLLTFDGGAVIRGIQHGVDIGYWGKANRDYIVRSPIGHISWTMLSSLGSISIYLADKIKPMRGLNKLKEYGSKISKNLSGSRKKRYAAEWLLGGVLAASAGIAGLMPIPFVCDLVDEGSNYLANKLQKHRKNN